MKWHFFAYAPTHQSHAPEHWNPIDTFHREIHQTGNDNDQVENIPAWLKVLLGQGRQFQDGLRGEKSSEDFVANLQHMFEVIRHTMVFYRQKRRVENDTDGHSRFKKHIRGHF